MYKLIDTNVLMDYPEIIFEEQCVIHSAVIAELDKLKVDRDKIRAKKASKASRILLNNRGGYLFDTSCTSIFTKLSTDDLLVKVAKKNKYQVISNDVNVLLKCEATGVQATLYATIQEDYTGTIYLSENDEEVANIYSNTFLAENYKINQYVIILREGDEPSNVLKFDGTKFKSVYPKNLTAGTFFKTVAPRNPEQNCLMDALRTCNIIYANGAYGTGKSMITTAYALQELLAGKINKIIYVPNNSTVDNTVDLGALPGTLYEKSMAYMGTLVDLIGSQAVEQLFGQGMLEIVPMAFMRGRNFENAIVLVSEAENLTGSHVKLLIGRCAENTKIIFDGDIKQSDSRIFKENNGLELLKQLSNSEEFADIFGMATLTHIERSKTARATTYLDQF